MSLNTCLSDPSLGIHFVGNAVVVLCDPDVTRQTHRCWTLQYVGGWSDVIVERMLAFRERDIYQEDKDIIPARESMANLIMTFDKGRELIFALTMYSIVPRKNTVARLAIGDVAPLVALVTTWIRVRAKTHM